jgi:hypothetical protein
MQCILYSVFSASPGFFCSWVLEFDKKWFVLSFWWTQQNGAQFKWWSDISEYSWHLPPGKFGLQYLDRHDCCVWDLHLTLHVTVIWLWVSLSGLFPFTFWTEILYEFLLNSVYAQHVFDLNTLTVLGKEYKMWSSLLFYFLIFPVSPLIILNILLAICYETPSMTVLSSDWESKFHTHTNQEAKLWVYVVRKVFRNTYLFAIHTCM